MMETVPSLEECEKSFRVSLGHLRRAVWESETHSAGYKAALDLIDLYLDYTNPFLNDYTFEQAVASVAEVVQEANEAIEEVVRDRREMLAAVAP